MRHHGPSKTNTFWPFLINGCNSNRNFQIILNPVDQLPSKTLIINFLGQSTMLSAEASCELTSEHYPPRLTEGTPTFTGNEFLSSHGLIFSRSFWVIFHLAYSPAGA